MALKAKNAQPFGANVDAFDLIYERLQQVSEDLIDTLIKITAIEERVKFHDKFLWAQLMGMLSIFAYLIRDMLSSAGGG